MAMVPQQPNQSVGNPAPPKKKRQVDPEDLYASLKKSLEQGKIAAQEGNAPLVQFYTNELKGSGVAELKRAALLEPDAGRRRKWRALITEIEAATGEKQKVKMTAKERAIFEQIKQGHLSKRAQKLYEQQMMHASLGRAGEGAEVQAELAGIKRGGLREGKPSLVDPEDRARFHRLFSAPPPGKKEEAKEEKKEAPKRATSTGQLAAGVAARHLRTRQIEKASQPSRPTRVKTPKLHVKKSALPKLTKGKNVKLTVPSGKLPRTGQMRNILHRSR